MTGSKFQTLEKWQDLNSKRCTHFFPSITLIPFWNYFLLLSNSQANLPTVEKLIFLSILCNAITLKNIQNHVNKILRWNKRIDVNMEPSKWSFTILVIQVFMYWILLKILRIFTRWIQNMGMVYKLLD